MTDNDDTKQFLKSSTMVVKPFQNDGTKRFSE